MSWFFMVKFFIFACGGTVWILILIIEFMCMQLQSEMNHLPVDDEECIDEVPSADACFEQAAYDFYNIYGDATTISVVDRCIFLTFQVWVMFNPSLLIIYLVMHFVAVHVDPPWPSPSDI